MATAHVSAVRSLYKRILVLHRRLPLEMKALGDEYVKAEFRRHKTAKPEEIANFMKEWQNYAVMLATQTGGVAPEQEVGVIGEHLSPDKLEDMNDMQVGQLYELFQETKKPSQFVHPEET